MIVLVGPQIAKQFAMECTDIASKQAAFQSVQHRFSSIGKNSFIASTVLEFAPYRDIIFWFQYVQNVYVPEDGVLNGQGNVFLMDTNAAPVSYDAARLDWSWHVRPLGLLWKEVPSPEGRSSYSSNATLEGKLRDKQLKFTQREFDSMKVENLRQNHVVKVDTKDAPSKYFVPLDRAETPHLVVSAPMNSRCGVNVPLAGPAWEMPEWLERGAQIKLRDRKAVGNDFFRSEGGLSALPWIHRPAKWTETALLEVDDDQIQFDALFGDGAAAKDEVANRPKLSPEDTERFLSLFTVPYLRIPLVLDFLNQDGHMHILSYRKVQRLVMSMLLEPQRGMLSTDRDEAPTQVPAPKEEEFKMATTCGILINECLEPELVPKSMLKLLKQATLLNLGTYTGSPQDEVSAQFGDTVARPCLTLMHCTAYSVFAHAGCVSSSQVLLFVITMAVRVETAIDFVLEHVRARRNPKSQPRMYLPALDLNDSAFKQLAMIRHEFSQWLGEGPKTTGEMGVRRFLRLWLNNLTAAETAISADRLIESKAVIYTHIFLTLRNVPARGQRALGLFWRELHGQPKEGSQIKNSALEAGLKELKDLNELKDLPDSVLEFTREELEAFQVGELQGDSYIKVKGKFFKPGGELTQHEVQDFLCSQMFLWQSGSVSGSRSADLRIDKTELCADQVGSNASRLTPPPHLPASLMCVLTYLAPASRLSSGRASMCLNGSTRQGETTTTRTVQTQRVSPSTLNR